MIPLQKKMNAVECSDHRAISLISHASTILLKIHTIRIEQRQGIFLGRNQFGLRIGCGTRNAIGVMRMICDKSLEFGNNVYICFVDFEKAFESELGKDDEGITEYRYRLEGPKNDK